MHAQRGMCGGAGAGAEWGIEGAGSGFLFGGWEFWGAAEAWEWGSVCVEEVGEIAATPERLEELAGFRLELMEILELATT